MVQPKSNPNTRKHSRDHLISIRYYQYIKLRCTMSLYNDLLRSKLSSLDFGTIMFAIQMK